MDPDIDPAVAARLRARAVLDQCDAALRDCLAIEDDVRGRPFAALRSNHAPATAERCRLDAMPDACNNAVACVMTTEQVAQLSGLDARAVRRLARRGGLPPPRHRGRRLWWDRSDIDEWLVQRSLP